MLIAVVPRRRQCRPLIARPSHHRWQCRPTLPAFGSRPAVHPALTDAPQRDVFPNRAREDPGPVALDQGTRVELLQLPVQCPERLDAKVARNASVLPSTHALGVPRIDQPRLTVESDAVAVPLKV